MTRESLPAGRGCPPPDVLQAFHMDVLPPALQDRVARHVADCEMCRMLDESLADPALLEITEGERERIAARISSRAGSLPSRRRWHLAAAAMLLVAVGAGGIAWRILRGPAATPPAGAVLTLDKAPVPDRHAPDLVWRDGRAAVAEDLRGALRPYEGGDYAAASRELAAHVARFPASARGYFYLGVSRMLAGAHAEAIAPLETAERLSLDDQATAREAAWYLALAYQRTGDHDRARLKLNTLCRRPDANASRACAALDQLK